MKKLAMILLRYWLKQSIGKNGIKAPVIVTIDNIVLDGNHRVMLAREMGVNVPAIRLPVTIEYLNPNELRTYYDEAEKEFEGNSAIAR